MSAYDEMLEDMVCPECGCVGMLPNGSYEYSCPNCYYEGNMLED